MIHIFGSKCTSTESFTFTFSTTSSIELALDWPASTPIPLNRPFKRRRALSDVDGEKGKKGRKKRRLRLHLITSRLSLPFSEPASNIVNRGFCRIPVWGSRRAHGKNLFRKAAIMNRVRRRLDALKDVMRLEQERKNREMVPLKDIVLHNPRCLDCPLPPSPLGLSNYDALDLDEGMFDYEVDPEDVDRASMIYSDFNIMDPASTNEGDEYAYLDEIDGISRDDLPAAPPAPPRDSIDEMLSREDGRGESIFVQIRQ